MIRSASLRMAPDGTEVLVDGRPMRGVVNFALTTTKDGLPRLTLDMVMHEMQVDGVVQVEIPRETRETLILLGWTPPEA